MPDATMSQAVEERSVMTTEVATGPAADRAEVCSVGVVGGGIMGSGIAEVAARNGCEVILLEVNDVAADNALARLRKSLGRAEKSGKLSAADREAAEGRLRTATDVAELADRDLVIEAVIEDEAEKVAIFQALGKVVRPDALLASNTSSIPIMKLAAVTPQPQRVIGMHFFNPVPVLPLVELVPSLLTSQETVERADAFASKQLKKHTVLSKDRAGFIVNALLIPYLLAAIRMVESGFASPEDIDTGMVDGCAHPMGPLALTDLIGLDTTMAVAQSMYAEFKEPLYAPPPLLLRMVEAGLLGRKAGRGFFNYPAK
jgi:3-hydroxybutyryl-CoA dehydrogenase